MKQQERVRALQQGPEFMLAVADARIAWALEHPDISDWLKQVLQTADGRDPIGLQNDVELLKHLIMPRSRARIAIAMRPLRLP